MASYANLHHFGFMSVTGRDACKFMQGYTTCDLDKLTEDQFQMGAICNLQGRMVTSFLVCRTTEGLLFRMHRQLVTTTIEFLSKYIVFSKASLADVSENFHCYGVMDLSNEPGSLKQTDLGYELQVSNNRAEGWFSSAPAGDDNSEQAWLLAEIADGIAWVEPETSEQFLPQMFNYDETGAIDFKKGCYLGQEIVARMQYRGDLKRRLHTLNTKSDVTTGSAVTTSSGKSLGTVVAVADHSCLAVLNEKADLSELNDSQFNLV